MTRSPRARTMARTLGSRRSTTSSRSSTTARTRWRRTTWTASSPLSSMRLGDLGLEHTTKVKRLFIFYTCTIVQVRIHRKMSIVTHPLTESLREVGSQRYFHIYKCDNLVHSQCDIGTCYITQSFEEILAFLLQAMSQWRETQALA